MSTFRIEFDWEADPGIRARELAATHARLEVWIGGSSVIRFHDAAAKTVRDYIYVSLYPLAEWISFNWFALLHETRTHGKTADSAFRSRHTTLGVSDGFAFPDLTLSSEGDTVHCRWNQRAVDSQNIQFMSCGDASVPSAEAKEQFESLLSAVCSRLDAYVGCETTPLQREWRYLQQLGAEVSTFCRAAAELGLDPFNLSDSDE